MTLENEGGIVSVDDGPVNLTPEADPANHVLPMRFRVQLRWHGTWMFVGPMFRTKEDAEWSIGQWKQQNACRGDRCFRVYDCIKNPEGL